MLRDIITELVESQDDMRITGEHDPDRSLRDLAIRLAPHVIILGVDGNEIPMDVRELVHEHMTTKVLAVEVDGRHAWLYELRPHQVRIGEISSHTLIDTIRASARVSEVQRS
jgi:chemotaxis response regulator CheB